MTSTFNKLESKLTAYPEKLQKRLYEDVMFKFSRGTEPDWEEVLRRIKTWLAKGVDAPTAVQSADGWHKKFDAINANAVFVVEGEGGSILVSRVTRLANLPKNAKPRGVDLDDPQWKTKLTAPKPPTKPQPQPATKPQPEPDPATALMGPDEN